MVREEKPRGDAPAPPPTLDQLNTGKGKPANLMTATEYSRYFNPIAAYLTYRVTGA